MLVPTFYFFHGRRWKTGRSCPRLLSSVLLESHAQDFFHGYRGVSGSQIFPETHGKDPVILLTVTVVMSVVIALQVGQITQQSSQIQMTQADTVSHVSDVLAKLSDVSKRKSLAVTSAGFDVLAGLFRNASIAKSLDGQYQILCVRGQPAFNRTSTAVNNANILSNSTRICSDYQVVTTKGSGISYHDYFSAVWDLESGLIKLDNAISLDP